MNSQYMRQNSQMRQGEITLQKIRINKKLKNKKAIALDVLKMLNEIEGKDYKQSNTNEAEEKFGGGDKQALKGSNPPHEIKEE